MYTRTYILIYMYIHIYFFNNFVITCMLQMPLAFLYIQVYPYDCIHVYIFVYSVRRCFIG